MREADMLSLLAGVIGSLGNKSIRGYQLPRARLEQMFAEAEYGSSRDSAELRRLQVGAMAGGDGDILTAEGSGEE